MRVLATMIKWFNTGNVAIFVLVMLVAITMFLWTTVFDRSGNALAQEAGKAKETIGNAKEEAAPKPYMGMGLIAVAVSTGASTIGAGIAVSLVGSAALAAVAENPEIMGRSIIFVGLAEGIAIYGLIISIMILGKL